LMHDRLTPSISCVRRCLERGISILGRRSCSDLQLRDDGVGLVASERNRGDPGGVGWRGGGGRIRCGVGGGQIGGRRGGSSQSFCDETHVFGVDSDGCRNQVSGVCGVERDGICGFGGY